MPTSSTGLKSRNSDIGKVGQSPDFPVGSNEVETNAQESYSEMKRANNRHGLQTFQRKELVHQFHVCGVQPNHTELIYRRQIHRVERLPQFTLVLAQVQPTEWRTCSTILCFLTYSRVAL